MHGRLATQSLSFGRILSDKATLRWRGGPHSKHQLTSTLERACLRRCRLSGGVMVPHVSEEKVTSRWRGSPRNRHQLHNSTRVAPQTDQASSR
ncbi:hypothetical protein V6N12_016243 [Hibiscus sabdariffa]|uniref:Uncharacterized protein n=1 Tax=Hibiscus sabdariffa TaxID=183260 RepID=A0ABR2CEP8_9ROSI